MRLIPPDKIWQPAIDIVRRRHAEHLAAFERQEGLPARTIQDLKTVDVLAFEGARLKTDALPCALIGVFGVTEKPIRRASEHLDFPWILAVEITVAGKNRSDTVQRCGWYAMTVAQCLLQRLPRHDSPVSALELQDMDLSAGPDQRERVRTIAQAQLIFTVDVDRGMSIDDLPADDSDLPPGTAGAAPADPYDEPVPWPEATGSETDDIKRSDQ